MSSNSEAVGSTSGPIASVGASFLGIAETAGGMALLFGRILKRLARFSCDGPELWRNLHRMGVKSLPIVVVTALFAGAIMVIQSSPIVERYGAQQLVGWAAGFGILREIGPLLTALMISGRVGANNTAELGTMVVTEQVDALRALAIDPIEYLIAPRFLGIVVTATLTSVYADALALLGAAITAQVLLGVEPWSFYNGLTGGLLNFGDVLHGIIKSAFFGVVLGISSCYFGMTVRGGAPGVGRAVNAAVVSSAACIFVLDYFLSFLLA